MSWEKDWFNNAQGINKPNLKWIESYTKADGTVVDGHWRTEENKTINDNLGTDIDNDGIPGFFDADENGDGILEAVDNNSNGIADQLEEIFEDLFG